MAASTRYNFYEGVDGNGKLQKVSKRFGRLREINLKLYDNDKLWVHLSDNSKCFTEEKKFDVSKSKSMSMQYDELAELKPILDMLELYKRKMVGENVRTDAQMSPAEAIPSYQIPAVPSYQTAGLTPTWQPIPAPQGYYSSQQY